jgi:hypothetical protein
MPVSVGPSILLFVGEMLELMLCGVGMLACVSCKTVVTSALLVTEESLRIYKVRDRWIACSETVPGLLLYER